MKNTIKKIFLLLLTALSVVCFAVACKEGGETSYTSSEDGSVHTHTPSEPVKENVVEGTLTTDGSYDEVVYCSSCNEEISRRTVNTGKLDHEHQPSEVKIENSTKPQIHSQDASLRKGYFDEVVYCLVCGDVISSVRTYNYYHQFDYLELSDAVNNSDGLTEVGDGEYLLNAKTNKGKDVRLFIVGEIERLDGGWGKFYQRNAYLFVGRVAGDKSRRIPSDVRRGEYNRNARVSDGFV